MIYHYDADGKIHMRSIDNDDVRPKPTRQDGKVTMLNLLVSDLLVPVDEWYVLEGELTPRLALPYTLSANAVALNQELVVTVPVGTRYQITGPSFAAEGESDDGTIEFASGAKGAFVFRLSFGNYLPCNLLVNVHG